MISNPVEIILKKYGKLREDEIIGEIGSWFFVTDARKVFNDAVESKQIIQIGNRWKLA